MLLLQVKLLVLFFGTLLLHECSCVNINVVKETPELYVVDKFAPPNAVINHIAVDEDLQNTYIGAQNILYQLDKNLKNVLTSVTVGPELDHPNCLPNKQCAETRVPTNNTNRLLLIDKGRDRLIACGSVFQGLCVARSMRDISVALTKIPDPFDVPDIIAANIEGGTIVGVISEGPTVNNSVLYIAATLPVDLYFSHDKPITTRSLQYDPSRENTTFTLAVEIKRQGQLEGSVLRKLDKRGRMRKYKYTFATGGVDDGFVYFVFSRPKNTDEKYRFIVARICKSDHFYLSYLELPINCGDNIMLNDLAGAYYSPNDSKGNSGTLYFLFLTDSSSGQVGSVVCSLTKKEIDDQFYTMMDICYKHQGKFPETTKSDPADVKCLYLCTCYNDDEPFMAQNISLDSFGPPAPLARQDYLPYYPEYRPPSTKRSCGAFYLPQHLTATWVTSAKMVFEKSATEFTAMTVNEISGVKVGFIGTADGSILQVKLDSSLEYNSIPLGSRILSDFIWDQDQSLLVPHLYVTTPSQVLRIRVAECQSKFTTCDACIHSNDPYCGWCILESRCTTEKECRTANNDKTRWLGPESPHCLIIDPPDPVDSSLPPAKLQFTINPLPSLERDELYQCVYNNSSFYNVTLDRVNKTAATVTCFRPAGSALSPTPNGEDYQNVTLSLRYNKKVDIISTSIPYYDCRVYGQQKMHRPCADCLNSQWNCRWCIVDGQCLSNTGQSVCVEDQQQCPTVLSIAPETRLIPVGMQQNIILLTDNLPTGGTPKCVIEFLSDEQENVEVKAEISGNRVTCQRHVYSYSQELQQVQAYVTLHWKLSYVVDSERDESSSVLTFYKCEVERSDCSRCVVTDAKYKCGWCKDDQKCTIQEFCPGASRQPPTWLIDGQYCEALTIEHFEPTNGPTTGGTEIHIFGLNMGTSVSDIDGVTLGSNPCTVIPQKYEVSIRIVCKTGNVTQPKLVPLSVTVKGRPATASEMFEYRNPTVTSVSPRRGPKAGGTLLTIKGTNLITGRNIWAELRKGNVLITECDVELEISEEKLKCVTNPSPDVAKNLDLIVGFDSFRQTLPASFSFEENPEIVKVSTLSLESFSSFLFGGRNVSIEGSNFDIVQKPLMSVSLRNSMDWSNIKVSEEVFERKYNRSCLVINSTFMQCYTPRITTSINEYDVPANMSMFANVFFIMDAIVVNHNQSLKYYPNPRFETWEEPVTKIKSQLLTIKAYNLEQAITKSEVQVLLGKNNICPVKSIEEEILCTVPDISVSEDQEFLVTVSIGGEFVHEVGYLLYDVETPPLGTPGIIGIVIAVTFVLGVGIFVIIYFVRKNRLYKANKNDFQKAMENLEMQVRNDFRKAFAELNVEMTDLTADGADYGIPCLDYRTYVTNLFFPSFKYHPCTKTPDPTASLANMELGLSQFLLLLSNHSFLSSFIHTLEEQKSFSNRDKGNVASLLTVALHHKLDYFTEIMKSLIKDVISVSVARNPKLILRRSDSVADRMLSNWMYICLYPYLRDKAGSPIFFLLKAIKQQVSKGPVDAVTGKARYTLSDDRLLQEDVENEMLTLFVAPLANTDDEPVIVKVLSCDSIAQVKEKVMDAVYKRIPFSQRPKADQLDIEWRHGRGGHLVLPSEDYRTEPNSRWRRLMTIADYKVTDNSTLALIPRQNEYDGSQDMSSVVSNVTMDTNPISPMLEEHLRMYHLTKFSDDVEGKRESTINRDRHKHIQEIYLLRLINMKGILQTYVDAVFHAILDNGSIPGPVKHFFHFLDEQANKHGITDPEMLHIWKTNSLFGRFWVTILKNPDSVFDIEKPDTIASTMAVISQTFIDACSVSEHKPNKDSPINKQLYAKEIPNYKKLVQEYYKVIKEQPPVSDQDVNAYIAEISREHQCEFDVNVALKELWGYLNKYYEEVNESLENDENIPSHIKQKLQQTYNLIDSA